VWFWIPRFQSESDPSEALWRMRGNDKTSSDFATEFLGQHTSKVAEKLCLQAAQKASEARRAKNRRAERTRAVRWSESIECNAAYEAFSAAC
jgi:hypothetical protein